MKKLAFMFSGFFYFAAAVFATETDDITGQVNNATSMMPDKATQDGLMASLSPGMIISGAVFGAFGLYAFNRGKKRQDALLIAIGIALLVYPWFVTNLLLNILIGGLLCGAFYYKRNG